MTTYIAIASQDPALFNDFQGDVSDIAIDDSLDAYDAYVVNAVGRLFPYAHVYNGATPGGEAVWVHGDAESDRDETEAILQAVEQAHIDAINHAEEWLVTVGA